MGVKLTNCTKTELLWVIEQAERLSLGNTRHYIDQALDDLEYKRNIDRIKKAKEFAEISHKAAVEYEMILEPYEGKPIRDIPMEVLKKADLALKRSKNANEKYLKLVRIKLEPPEEG